MDGRSPTGIQINLATYADDKEKGVVHVVKIHDTPQYSRRQFDPETGAPVQAFVKLDVSALKTQAEAMEQDLAAIRSLINDAETADELIKPKATKGK